MAYSNNPNIRLRELLIDMNFKGTIHQMQTIQLLLKKPMTKTEIQLKINRSNNTINYMLQKFEEKGMLKFEPNLNDLRGQLLSISDEFRKKITHRPIMHTH